MNDHQARLQGGCHLLTPEQSPGVLPKALVCHRILLLAPCSEDGMGTGTSKAM